MTDVENRFDISSGDIEMMAIVTIGNGGYDKLEYRAVPRPVPGHGEVLLRVLAAGVNNTEINTRLGWYSSSVTESTDSTSLQQNDESAQVADGGWNEATPFPLIQGTDCCGQVVSAGSGADSSADSSAIGKRVLVRSCMRSNGYASLDNIWMASDFDGAFAQYVVVPEAEVFPVDCTWTDEELATIPCAYGTAENMLNRASVGNDSHVVVSGASGGVGSAAVQLAKRRGAKVTAICGAAKAEQVRSIGADTVLARDGASDVAGDSARDSACDTNGGFDLVRSLGENVVDVVVDNVAGEGFANMLKVLKRGGRYVSSGAIAGPIVSLDMRDMYLKDITLIGCTAWDEPVFPDLIGYIERGEIKPLVAQIYPLEQIAEAQREFMEKKHFGNFVLVPPAIGG